MNIQPVSIRCSTCGTETELDELHYKCPACDGLDVAITGGDEMLLMSLEMI